MKIEEMKRKMKKKKKRKFGKQEVEESFVREEASEGDHVILNLPPL